jgi:hypothetical protein
MVPMAAQLLVYPVLVVVLGVLVLLTVPKSRLDALLPFGVVLGGLLDYLYSEFMGPLLGITAFKNLGFLQASGHPLLGHIAWVFIVVLFLHFWPEDNRYLGSLYGLAWALLATGFSQVVRNLGVFEYAPWFYPIPMLLLFIARFAITVWAAKRLQLLR